MSAMEKWINGAEGREVKRVIEQNFNTLSRHLSSNILALTTQERVTLGEAYLRQGLRIYDITLNKWFRYSGNVWVECQTESMSDYTYEFTKSNWENNTIMLEANEHHTQNPIVQLFIKDGQMYSPVIGGVSVDKNFNITISTDMPFAGKVVVK